jgi:uncharacterized protein
LILCDAGPLVAIVDRTDVHHARCKALLPSLNAPLITTWACLAEAMYLLGRYFGFQAQEELWQLLERGIVVIYDHDRGEQDRMRSLMTTYQNVPMDLADASKVTAAEAMGLTRIFTIDGDFRIYRTKEGSSFDVVP